MRGGLALLIVSISLALGSGCISSYSPGSTQLPWGPWEEEAPSSRAGDRADTEGLSDALLSGYQKYLRRPQAASAGGCQFHPSCSAYGREAYQQYGFAIGSTMTFVRLFITEPYANRSNFDLVRIGKTVYYYDPTH